MNKNGLYTSSTTSSIEPRNNHHYNITYQNYLLSKLSFITKTTNNLSLSKKSKHFDYLFKFLLVGDSDVGKDEIISYLGKENFEFGCVGFKVTTVLIDGKRIKIQIWDTSGQGRFSTTIRYYSRGAHGIFLVYDITNKWSFSSLTRWLEEIEKHVPGIPKILIGNRLHLAFRRQVNTYTAENYARKHNMSFFEISPMCDYNISESFAELTRIILQRHGLESFWKHSTVLSLQEICCKTILSKIKLCSIDELILPNSLKFCLKSYASFSNYRPNEKYINRYKNKKNNFSFCVKAKSLFTSMFKSKT